MTERRQQRVSWPRLALAMAALAGLFAMHGLADHGGQGAVPAVAAQTHVAADAMHQHSSVPAAGDVAHAVGATSAVTASGSVGAASMAVVQAALVGHDHAPLRGHSGGHDGGHGGLAGLCLAVLLLVLVVASVRRIPASEVLVRDLWFEPSIQRAVAWWRPPHYALRVMRC